MLINRKDARFYYPFESNVNDSSGGGADATVNGTAVYIDSISGKAHDFNGSTQIDTQITNLQNGSFSVLLRGSFDAFTSNQRLISYQTSGTGNPSWLLRYDNTSSSVKFFVRNQADTAYHTCEIADSLLSTGTIYAIHAYFDAGTEVGIEVYEQDGTLNTNTSSTTDTTFTNNSSNLVIGSDSNLSTPSDYLNGVVDDCIYIDGSKITSDEFYRFYLGLGLPDKVDYTFNQSMSFDGIDEYIDTNNDTSYEFDRNDTFSFSAWVKFDSIAGNNTIVSKYDVATSRGYYFRVESSGRVRFALGRNFSGGNARIIRETSTVLSTGVWYHLAGTYDGSTTKEGVNVYINGIAETSWNLDLDSLSTGAVITTPGFNLFIGNLEGTSNYMGGYIDELSIWNKELSQAEVREIINCGYKSNLKLHSANNNLVSWFKMGDRGSVVNIPDEVSSNNGTPTNMESVDVVADTYPYNEKALSFDGVDEYVDCGASTDFDFDRLTPFSISFWYKGTDTVCGFIGKTSISGSYLGWSMYSATNLIRFDMTVSALDKIRVRNTSTGAHSTGTWKHIVATYDGSGNANGVSMYINGNSIATAIEDNTLVSSIVNAQTVKLANARSGGYMSGEMDEVSIWNKELSAAEVTELYNSGTPCYLLHHSAVANLVSWWGMGDNKDISTIPDKKGANDGTPTNMEAADIVNNNF